MLNMPPDAWTIDTAGIINVHTSQKMSQGKYQDQNAMAGFGAARYGFTPDVYSNEKVCMRLIPAHS